MGQLVTVMRNMMFFPIALLMAGSCATRPCCTDYVIITPVEYVEPNNKPNSQFGWIETNKENATTYSVLVGNRQFFALLDKVGEENIVDELATFVEEEVVSHGYCSTGNASTRTKGIIGPHTGEHVSLLVNCDE